MQEFFLIFLGILLPFWGTILGSGTVFFLKNHLHNTEKVIFFGFAGGVMLAASVWSLLIPAMDMEEGVFSTVSGFLCGVLCFVTADRLLSKRNPSKTQEKKSRKLAFAVTLHNLPEGMAVGVVFSRALETGIWITPLLLSLGIALQNIPEGAIISLPLKSVGMKKSKAFFYGAGSGAVEPIGAVFALLFTFLIRPLLPFILSFAAGSMIYVTAKEIIPAIEGKKEFWGYFAFALGFSVMMSMDVLLG